MDVRADEASVQALRDAGVEVTKDGFSTTGRAVVDMTKKTLTYVVSKDGIDRGPDRTARPEPAALLGGRPGQADADDEGRRRQAAVRERVAPRCLQGADYPAVNASPCATFALILRTYRSVCSAL